MTAINPDIRPGFPGRRPVPGDNTTVRRPPAPRRRQEPERRPWQRPPRTEDPARQIVQQWLTEFLGDPGLARSLTRWAWGRFKELGGGTDPTNAYQIIDLEMRERDEFKARFPAYDALRAQGQAWEPGEIIAYERRAKEALGRLGAEEDYTNAEIQQWLIGGVSQAELDDRIDMAYQAAQAPSEAADALRRMYGLDGSLLARFWLDPDRTQAKIEQMWRAGTIGASAQIAGFGGLSAGEAEMLAGRVGAEQAQQAFGGLVAQRDLMAQQVGEADAVSRDQQIAAVSGDARAQEFIQRRLRRRQAQFEGAGGFAASRAGVVGLGSNAGV